LQELLNNDCRQYRILSQYRPTLNHRPANIHISQTHTPWDLIHEASTLVRRNITIFWNVTLHFLEATYQNFGKTHCLHFQSKRTLMIKWAGSSKILVPRNHTTQHHILEDHNLYLQTLFIYLAHQTSNPLWRFIRFHKTIRMQAIWLWASLSWLRQSLKN
jgi:hypothetical protein